MPAVYLLRHGQASFGAADYDVLSPLGVEQAEVAGRELARRGARQPVLASGTLQRQRDTALAAGAVLGVADVVIDPRWDELPAHALVEERLGGPATGITSAEFQVHLDAAMTEWIDSGSASWREFSDGALDALRDLAASVPAGRDAVAVTSSGVTAAVCGRLLGTGAAGVIALNRVSVNASITTIAASPRGLSVVSFNDHAHVARALITHR